MSDSVGAVLRADRASTADLVGNHAGWPHGRLWCGCRQPSGQVVPTVHMHSDILHFGGLGLSTTRIRDIEIGRALADRRGD